MCSLCKGLFLGIFKALHQTICPENGNNLILSVNFVSGVKTCNETFWMLHKDNTWDYL